ncbi:hypothetical protein KBY66_11665 [Synechococcus sp. Tobar12-5m-g]|nr:hypothetical protein [Synechococcus sp. Tobar12-5m-g]MCP9874323.1 hypothetical protein [Synechococcus sp. Cruz CV-v-12]
MLWGALADRFGRRPVALAGMVLFSVALVVVPGFAPFQALRLCRGWGRAAAPRCRGRLCATCSATGGSQRRCRG